MWWMWCRSRLYHIKIQLVAVWLQFGAAAGYRTRTAMLNEEGTTRGLVLVALLPGEGGLPRLPRYLIWGRLCGEDVGRGEGGRSEESASEARREARSQGALRKSVMVRERTEKSGPVATGSSFLSREKKPAATGRVWMSHAATAHACRLPWSTPRLECLAAAVVRFGVESGMSSSSHRPGEQEELVLRTLC